LEASTVIARGAWVPGLACVAGCCPVVPVDTVARIASGINNILILILTFAFLIMAYCFPNAA